MSRQTKYHKKKSEMSRQQTILELFLGVSYLQTQNQNPPGSSDSVATTISEPNSDYYQNESIRRDVVHTFHHLTQPANTTKGQRFSPKILKILRAIIMIGWMTGIIPWKWDDATGQLSKIEDKKRFKLWRILAIIHIVLRCCSPVYILLYISYYKVPNYELLVATWVVGIHMVTVNILVILLVSDLEMELRNLLNGGLRFNSMMVHSEDFSDASEPKDVETILCVMVVSIAIITILCGPAAKMGLVLDWELLRFIRYLEFPGFYDIVSLGIVYLYTVDFTIVGLMVFMCVIYTNSMANWLAALSWQGTHGSSEVINRRFQIIYRAHQVLHRYAEEFLHYIIPIVLGLAIIVSIAVLYSLLGLFNVLNLPFLICCGILAILVIYLIKYICWICEKFTTNSEAYHESFHRTHEREERHLVDKLFFRSFQPIIFHVGSFKLLNNSIFLPILSNVIIGWVITFLLSSEKPAERLR